MFSRNSLIQILHRTTSVCNLIAVLTITTCFLPSFAQDRAEEGYPLSMEEADEVAASDQLLETAISSL